MIRTLRITSIFIALGAIFFIIFVAVTGLSADEKTEAFLKSPGLAEQAQAGSAVGKSEQQQESALVRQAKAFALRIDPPPEVTPTRIKKSHTSRPRPKGSVSAKFELIGTSHYPLDPENSWALINEVGKGWHWVRQGGKVGHLTIKDISDGFIVIDDGGKTSELAPNRSGGRYLLENDVNKNIARSSVEPKQQPKKSKTDLLSNIEWLKTVQNESMGLDGNEVDNLGDMGKILSSLEGELESFESNSVSDNNSVTDANNAESSEKTEESGEE